MNPVTQGQFQNELWKHCALAVYGGAYLDTDSSLFENFSYAFSDRNSNYAVIGKAAVYSVATMSKSNTFLSASNDCSAKLWDTRSGKIIHTFRGHRGEISCARFNHSVSWN